MKESGNEHPSYVPPELVNCSSKAYNVTYQYYCYLMELKQDYKYEVCVRDIVLAIRSKLDPQIIDALSGTSFVVERGKLSLNLTPANTIQLSPEEVEQCRRFQTTLFRILLNRDENELPSASDNFSFGDNPEFDYLLLPAVEDQTPSNSIIDWKSVYSFPFSSESSCDCNCKDHACDVRIKNGSVCSCKLENCVVYTPHSKSLYTMTPIIWDLNGNSTLRYGTATYKEHFKNKHGIELRFPEQSLLRGRKVFEIGNYLLKDRKNKNKGEKMSSEELPPELCSVIMSPISIGTIYSFSFIPSIMHWLEGLLVAFNLKKMLLDHCTKNDIPIIKVFEAITAKGCQEAYNYENLETLGDSFLKYAVSQQLFKTHQNDREGTLSKLKEKLVSNVALRKFASDKNLPGFIRMEAFDPKKWIIPGDKSKSLLLEERLVSSGRTSMYVGRKRKIELKKVADVVEALIGAIISTGDEESALSFINWIGIEVDTNIMPYERHLSIDPENLVKVKDLESVLNYKFEDPYLLVEALTHGSYKRPEIRTCYERLEFLGDAVLDNLITMHLYGEYVNENFSPGFLTTMRSISVNNECYALSAIKAKLNEHILCDPVVAKNIEKTMKVAENLSLDSTFGWQLETYFSPVLADVIESIAGAIFVDSGYKKEIVFKSIRPLLEPLVTPETAKRHPISELQELCQKNQYKLTEHEQPPVRENDENLFIIEVKANRITRTAKASNKDTARKMASKELLKELQICKNVG
ncbi:endoribonuclease Dicer homolog 2 isoform X2 [Vigna radiata var. radiata]|uniref:Endoribonuclease Dicer homolog 2 isoform X2 n=1 Tax=Vigna radiata var. radiata TaxID=3916 RepID=A0A1S3TCH9_VIGRR|nr:endoribonuclease Dicer homolog 2 isoform X2 [Vigna radiata var. radiata]